jgi:hypothetical protein
MYNLLEKLFVEVSIGFNSEAGAIDPMFQVSF